MASMMASEAAAGLASGNVPGQGQSLRLFRICFVIVHVINAFSVRRRCNVNFFATHQERGRTNQASAASIGLVSLTSRNFVNIMHWTGIEMN
jgi:hypothetical protein